MTEKLIITPKTRIRELIDAYPEVEETLVSLAPAFNKLRNPVLRNTVARVTSLSQAAVIGNIDIADMIKCLRLKIGQNIPDVLSNTDSEIMKTTPDWFKKDNVVATLDARPMLEAGLHPIAEVFNHLSKLSNGNIFELITGFIPAPLIDKARDKGFVAYSVEGNNGEFHTYFCKP